ncbi:MAG: CCA tRNA nucleotidyltransferase [archaeon]|nr:MAG: CCA tRNA nucleotidyltransferase [archaeon]
MKTLTRVLKQVRLEVEPTPQEESRVRSLSKSLLSKTRAAAALHPETRGVLLGGSLAKGTWLPQNVDIDIYVKIDPSTTEERFEQVGLEVGRTATRGHARGKKYAQHPYTEAIVDGVRVNVVPCFDVRKGEWKSAADRSPYHVSLIRRLPAKVKAEVKVLKRFMKAAGVYGAEIEIRGFSGYAAEVLVYKHGSFERVLKSFATIKPQDPKKLFVLPDPVDKKRDLGIAVSGEKLGVMVMASREFLRHPEAAQFEPMNRKKRSGLADDVVALTFSHPPLSEDTLWGEIRKTMKHVVRHLEVSGFHVARAMGASDNARKSAILLLPEFRELPHLEQRIGPTVDRSRDVSAFISSNRKEANLLWVDDDARVRLVRRRKYIRVTDLLEHLMAGEAGSFGASKDLESSLKKTGRVLQGPGLRKAAAASPWLESGINELLTNAF